MKTSMNCIKNGVANKVTAAAVMGLFALSVMASTPSFAFGNFLKKIDINKALDKTKKAVEATKDITEPEEIQMGDGIGAMILGASPLYPDQNLQRYVNKVGRWVASQSLRPDLPWAFAVIDTPTINAFALPGGKVFISTGLVAKLTSEAELAGVLAHEVAHVMQKHQITAIQSARKSGFLQDIGQEVAADRLARTSLGSNALTGAIANAAASEAIDFVKNGLFLRPLDKSLEYEADRIGALLLAKAGYDPYGLISVIQKLATLNPEDSAASIVMSTHPSAADRLAQLESFAGTLDRFSSQPQVEDRFVKVMSQVK